MLKANIQILTKLSTCLNNWTSTTVCAQLHNTALSGFGLEKMSLHGVCQLRWAADLPELIEPVMQVLLHLLQPGEVSVTLLQGSEWVLLSGRLQLCLTLLLCCLGQECLMERKCACVEVMITLLKRCLRLYSSDARDYILRPFVLCLLCS